MKRTDLVEALKRVAPALSVKDLVPAFSDFFFDGERLQAFDGVVAIQTPLAAPIKCGLPGKLLGEFLGASHATDVEFTFSEGKAEVKAGRARMSLPSLPLEDFPFKWPDAKSISIEASDALLAAVKACETTMGVDPSQPALLGITIEVEPDHLVLYSSTNLQMTSCVVKVKPPKVLVGRTFVLPVRFCELLLARARPDTIAIGADAVQAHYKDGTRLFSATTGEASAKTFRTVMDGVDWKDGFVKVPKGLEGCLSRALVVMSGDETQHTDVTIKGDRMRFQTVTRVAVATDYVVIEKHPDAEVSVRPSLLVGPLEHAAEIRVLKACVAFKGPNYKSMVSVVGA